MTTAKVIQVIRVETNRGAGTHEDPCRTVIEYFSVDGQLLVTDDPWRSEMINYQVPHTSPR